MNTIFALASQTKSLTKITKINRVKRLRSIFVLILCTFLVSFTQVAPAGYYPYAIKTVVIDPGHGGHDTGCIGAISKEKQVALDIALRVGAYIEANCPNVKVIYTRKTDVFIPLIDRARIANNAKADLFISIHCNASKNKTAYGTETFSMGLHVANANLDVARRENAVILLEEDYEANYEGFDPNSPEAYIIFSLYQNVNLDKSLSIAAKVQEKFEKLERINRGVKQAGFLVLYKTNMPSILIETGFLTNRDEEKYMNSEEGQDSIASSIYEAFLEYKAEMESTN